MHDSTFNITNKTKGKLPRLPFAEIKEAILGKTYDLSLVFIGERRSRNLNETYKNKQTSATVLSFPLEKKSGEIFITPKRAERQAHKFNKTKREFVGFLFIHGLLHLKGYAHGSKMEEAEKKYCRMFNL
tara:strand:- start:128 stop:514 length:387 start_codon:yes stop_codon:yes gene_type:complete